MSTQPKWTALTFSEVIDWAVELDTFTATDLALEMGVDHDTGVRCVKALLGQGICRDTGDVIDGRHGYEAIVKYTPLPPGPTKREPSAPDPVQQAISQAGPIRVQRGTPVRIRTERQMRKSLSTPGARQHHKNNERNYQRVVAAKQARAEAQKSKAQKQPKWKKNK